MACILCQSENTFELDDEVLCSDCGTVTIAEDFHGHRLSYFTHPNGGWSVEIRCAVMGLFLEHDCESLQAAKDRAREILEQFGRVEY